MTLQQKLYQLIISRLNGNDIHSEPYRGRIIDLVRKGIGGFIVFGGERERIISFIGELQSLAEPPLFIASDIERGVGQQIDGCTMFPSQMAFAAAIDKDNPEDVSLMKDCLSAIALEAIDAGINMPLIPVLDINSNPDNPIICTRAFSDNAADVSWFGAEFIKVLEEAGLIACAKHFPGHGDTSIDSHIALPVIAKSFDELMKMELVPFIEAVNAGIRSIMIGHLTLPAIDSSPASLSGKIITGLLRKRLGFNGLVITDALNMSALDHFENVPARCMAAGVDILLHPSDPDLTVKQLEEAISSGTLDEEIIDNAVERILKVKRDLSGIKKVPIDLRKHEALSKYITERAVTLVKGADENPPLCSRGGLGGWFSIENAQLIIAGEKKFYSALALPPFNKGGMGGFITTIYAIFSETSAWKGRSGIDKIEIGRVEKMIREMVNNSGRSIVISFGSPYVLRYFGDADVLIAAYGNNEKSQRAVMNCLMGKTEFKGHLPVKIFT